MTAISDASAAEARAEATQSLISAGRTLFTERGYRQTDYADIAKEAGFDADYARDLLPDKAAVYGALIERTVRVAGLLAPAVAEGIDDDLPVRLARLYLNLWEQGEEGESPLVEVYRIGLSDKEASAVLRTRIAETLNSMVDQELGGDTPEVRTALFGAQLGGTAIVRHLLGVKAVASLDIETVIATITPALRDTLLAAPTAD
ncbi:TetR/AcrR family transcriptional regulator [Streptomyces sp. 7R007]